MIDHKERKFSVSISVYKNDDPSHFKSAIESVYKQTLKPNEVVLVVDGPVSDEISQIIHNFKKTNPNFKVIWLKENLGHAGARRVGLENCSNEIIALMDSDDLSVKDRFEKQIKVLLKNKNISVVGGQIEEFDDDKNKVIGNRFVPLEDKYIKEYMKYRCPMNQVTVMFRKQDVLKAGGYLDWHNNEDYYLWIRMVLANQKFRNLNDILVRVRVNDNMYKRRGGWLYYKSEKKIQKLMLNKKIISKYRYLINTSIRFIIQVLIPNYLRRYLFVKLFRKKQVL
jgi:glycosyltransferase involved in cell wall biosynthesis